MMKLCIVIYCYISFIDLIYFSRRKCSRRKTKDHFSFDGFCSSLRFNDLFHFRCQLTSVLFRDYDAKDLK